MKLNDLMLIKNKFLWKKNDLERQYKPIETKLEKINNDKLEKIMKIGIPMAIVYFVITFLSKFNIFITAFTNILPLWSLPIIHIASTSITGIIAKKIREKNVGKDNKSSKEKNMDRIKLSIELYKMKKRNSIFYNAYMEICKEIDDISKLSKKYTIIEKDETNTEGKLQTKITQTKASLEIDYKNLDLLITEYTIKAKLAYGIILDTTPLIRNIFIYTGGVLAFCIPFATISNNILYLISFLIGSSITKLYISNKSKMNKEIFDELSKELLESKMQYFNKNIDLDLRTLEKKISQLQDVIIKKEIRIENYQVSLNNLTNQNPTIRKIRILPRKDVISNNLPKRKILGIKKLENKRYY